MQSTDLNSFIENNKEFIKIKDGESFLGTFEKSTIGMSRFKHGKEIVIYWLIPKGMQKAIAWENSAVYVAEEFSKITSGQKIKITRTGSEAKDTKYTIEPQVDF